MRHLSGHNSNSFPHEDATTLYTSVGYSVSLPITSHHMAFSLNGLLFWFRRLGYSALSFGHGPPPFLPLSSNGAYSSSQSLLSVGEPNSTCLS